MAAANDYERLSLLTHAYTTDVPTNDKRQQQQQEGRKDWRLKYSTDSSLHCIRA